MTWACDCPRSAYFYSVYTNRRICRTHWTDEPEREQATVQDSVSDTVTVKPAV